MMLKAMRQASSAVSGTGVDATAKPGRSSLAVLVVALLLLATFFVATNAVHGQEVSKLPSRPTIELPVGQGRIVRFNEPVESVLVADTTIADIQVVASDIVYVFGLKPGNTNFIAITADKRIKATAQLRVSPDLAPANQAKRALQPTSTVDLSVFGSRLVVTGQAQDVQEAINTETVARDYSDAEQPPINNMTVQGSQQVNIRVRFAEVSRRELQSYGVDWNVGYKSAGFEFNMFQNNGVPASAEDANFGLSLGQEHGLNFEVFVEALQRNGIVKILAEPNLTAMTGQTASFLAGGEIPVPIPQGRDTVTVEYKSFGVSLNFTPTLIGRERIALHVRPEVSSISAGAVASAGGLNMPSFTVRKADTTVEVASGQTFAIAGLFQQNFTRNLEKFPVLGDVPVLGPLFQSQRFQKEETELVILITPYLVEPIRDKLATPADRPAAKRAKRSAKSSSTGLIVK